MESIHETHTALGDMVIMIGYVYAVGPISDKIGPDLKGQFPGVTTAFNIWIPTGQMSLFYETEWEAIIERARLVNAMMNFKSMTNMGNMIEAMTELGKGDSGTDW